MREACPDGSLAADGRPVLVLPAATRLKRGYTLTYHAVGGMSIAYRALRSDGSVFLAKEVAADDGRGMLALTQEKALLERLNHPGIVKVHDLFEEDGYFYLILEFIHGASLDEQIAAPQSGFLNERTVRGWGAELCEILEYLHRLEPPVIYRDLKPKNVMRDQAGRLRLIDFGIARLYKEGKTQDTALMGSALTASPEHYGGQTDARSDIYTLAATLHYLLTNGRADRDTPFDFPPVRSVNPGISDEMEAILARCLRRKPDERYQSARELGRVLLGQPEISPPRKLAPAVETSAHPALMWVAGALVLGLAVLIGFWLARRSSPLPETAPAVTSSPLPAVSPAPVARTVASPEVGSHPISTGQDYVVQRRRPRPPRLLPSAETPVVANLSDPPNLPPPSYPTRVHVGVDNRTEPAPQSDDCLARVGPAWWGLVQLRKLQLDDSSGDTPTSVMGPNGLFKFHLPSGWRLFGGDSQRIVLQPDGRGRGRAISLFTQPGSALSSTELRDNRRRSLAANFSGTVSETRSARSLLIGGQPATVLTFELSGSVLGKRKFEGEEVYWSHSNPNWTLIAALVAQERAFPDLQPDFEQLLRGLKL